MTSPDLDGVLHAHEVCIAYLFGSRADSTARPDSDHDVAVLFGAAEPPFAATALLAEGLAGVLETPVDVVDLDRADLELRGRVAETGRLLASRDEARRVRFEVDARLRWIELRPLVAATTGARNVIVHLDAEVDDERLAAFVRDGGPDDLDAFATRIAALTT